VEETTSLQIRSLHEALLTTALEFELFPSQTAMMVVGWDDVQAEADRWVIIFLAVRSLALRVQTASWSVVASLSAKFVKDVSMFSGFSTEFGLEFLK
jgi:hypothetical protein